MRIKKTNPETIITRSIRQFLTMNKIFHWKNWGGPLSEKGVADLLGVLPDGRFLGIEVKTEKGKLRPEQMNFLQNITDNGGVAFVARSVEDVQGWLESEGVSLRLKFKGV